MSFLDDSAIRKILNLQGSPLIQKAIADRQLEVIRKGFNYLSKEENTALYIADEVGLGKTYIALGIASLLRHFSSNPENHQDVILVPKENLQQKWRKEILQFSRNNYLLTDNRVKSVIGFPTGEVTIHEQLEAISADVPAYHLYRNTSFSFGLSVNGKKNMAEELKKYFHDEYSLEKLQQARDLGYFSEKHKPRLKKLCAYLMAVVNPSIELLIVDEGHNFKSGPGGDDNADVAARNAVAARFFGIKLNSEEDKIIFEHFPDLRGKIKPRVQKLLVLSATPKTYSLLELRRQLDCFLPKHLLSGCKRDSEIIELLPHFLIRGKMEYTISNDRYTRNQCRFEHRKGNVQKSEEASPIRLEEGGQALFMGVLQYNTIKHLNLSHNGNLEMGMLAGFETYRLDAHRSLKDAPEYEDVRSSKVSSSQDHHILEQMVDSWEENFRDPPPHPKQSVIVEALLELMKRGEKALVFVRRVASAIEMESRLMSRWEKEVISPELRSRWMGIMPSKELSSLLLAYEEYEENKHLREQIGDIIDG
ncbi:MAG: DEAD/DEAH box helicase family protein, partial [Bacteroidota bacterium]